MSYALVRYVIIYRHLCVEKIQVPGLWQVFLHCSLAEAMFFLLFFPACHTTLMPSDQPLKNGPTSAHTQIFSLSRGTGLTTRTLLYTVLMCVCVQHCLHWEIFWSDLFGLFWYKSRWILQFPLNDFVFMKMHWRSWDPKDTSWNVFG